MRSRAMVFEIGGALAGSCLVLVRLPPLEGAAGEACQAVNQLVAQSDVPWRCSGVLPKYPV